MSQNLKILNIWRKLNTCSLSVYNRFQARMLRKYGGYFRGVHITANGIFANIEFDTNV